MSGQRLVVALLAAVLSVPAGAQPRPQFPIMVVVIPWETLQASSFRRSRGRRGNIKSA